MKKKLFAVISLFTAAMCTLFLFACTGNVDPGGGDTGTQSHTHNYVWVDNGDGTHKQHCSVDGCDAPDINVGDHDYTNGNCVCGKEKPEEIHTHTYNKQITNAEYLISAATCTKKAKYYYSCECGEKGTETYEYGEVDPNAHTEATDNAVAPTCTEKGKTAGKHCSECKSVLIEQTEIEALDHNYTDCVCTRCHAIDPTAPETVGLEYELNTDGTGYDVIGIGTAAGNYIKIPSEYNGKAVTGIGYNAFSNCKELTNIIIPNSVTGIGEGAFYNCIGLNSIIIPDSVTYIGQFAFNGEPLTIYCETTSRPSDWSFYWNNSRNIHPCPVVWDCKNNDKDKGGYAYSVINGVHYKLKDGVAIVIRQPSSINSAVNIPASVSYKDASYSVTSIVNEAFYNCSKLTSITVPDGVTNIGQRAFYGCDNLTSITIPDGVTSIGESAFTGCSKLTNVYYIGTTEEWTAITIDPTNSKLTSATVYYYSEKQPSTSGNYWHYVNGVPTAWQSAS